LIPFVKAHACGNDFLIVEEPVEETLRSSIARRLCQRHTGVGADGVEYLALGDHGGYSIRLFNADGSEGELSGNGTRCVAAYLAAQDDSDVISIRTHAGVRHCRILERNYPRYQVETGMGTPRVTSKPVLLRDGTNVAGFDVFVGNPHYVLFIEGEDFNCFGRTWQDVGAEICTHPAFPAGTNVEFVRVIDNDRIEFRIYERGVGPTQSSGTGTSASAAASIVARGVARRLTVIAQGGEQTVSWPEAGASLSLTGPAEIIAQGDYLLA
jgi:diaminopimelate epimerase